ncbi:PepSY domain-containing protein [Prosthecomicrobium sp. N25]|uniref:PepSY domain-containing protein n=1 Tax=Prosthecomicrobium sp. N25 TaxID=3129254 RepID=UPI003077DEC3
MTTRTLTALLAAGLALGAFVLPARADGPRCPAPAAGTAAVSTGTLQAKLESMGYRVLETEREHRCTVIVAVNDSGFPVELTYEPASGEMVRAALHR